MTKNIDRLFFGYLFKICRYLATSAHLMKNHLLFLLSVTLVSISGAFVCNHIFMVSLVILALMLSYKQHSLYHFISIGFAYLACFILSLLLSDPLPMRFNSSDTFINVLICFMALCFIGCILSTFFYLKSEIILLKSKKAYQYR
jgi:hypothetical protein